MNLEQITLLNDSVEALAVERDAVETELQSPEEMVESLLSFDNGGAVEYSSEDELVFPEYTQQSGWKFLAIGAGVAAVALGGYLIYKKLKDKDIEDKVKKACDKLVESLGEFSAEKMPDWSEFVEANMGAAAEEAKAEVRVATKKVESFEAQIKNAEEVELSPAQIKELEEKAEQARKEKEAAEEAIKQKGLTEEKARKLEEAKKAYREGLEKKDRELDASRKAADKEVADILAKSGTKMLPTVMLTNLLTIQLSYKKGAESLAQALVNTLVTLKGVTTVLDGGDDRNGRVYAFVPDLMTELAWARSGEDASDEYKKFGGMYLASVVLDGNNFFNNFSNGVIAVRGSMADMLATDKAINKNGQVISNADLSRVIELLPQTTAFNELISAEKFELNDLVDTKSVSDKITKQMQEATDFIGKIEKMKVEDANLKRVKKVALDFAGAMGSAVADFTTSQAKIQTLHVRILAARVKAIKDKERVVHTVLRPKGDYTQQGLLESMQAIGGKLTSMFAKAKTALTAFLETGSDDVMSLSTREYSNLTKGNYVALMEKRVVIPKGLNKTYLQYLTVLQGLSAYITPLYSDVLIPAEKFLASLLNDPDELSSSRPNGKLANVKTIDVTRAKKEWAACFDNSGRERAPFGDVVKSLAEWPKIVSEFNDIKDVKLKAFTKEQVGDKVTDIVELINMLTANMEEQPDAYKTSGVTAKSLSEFTYQVAVHVEFYAMYLFALEQLRASIEYAKQTQLS